MKKIILAVLALFVSMNCVSAQTFTKQTTGLDENKSIHFFDDATGIATGQKGIVRTTDGGAKWTSVYGKNDVYTYIYNTAFLPGSMTGFAIGCKTLPVNTNLYLKTTDGGAHWEDISISKKLFDGMPQTITCSGTKSVLITSNAGRLLASSDAGLNWMADTNVSVWQFETRGAVVKEGNIFVLGGELYKTDNLSKWSVCRFDSAKGAPGIEMYTLKTFGTKIIAGGLQYNRGPIISMTKNLGKDWKNSILPTPGYVNDVVFADSWTGYACGNVLNGSIPYPGFIFKTTDGGETWNQVPTPPDLPGLSGLSIGKKVVYYFGYNYIYKQTD